MSTKIYNAYIFNDSPDKIVPILREIKKEYIEMMRERILLFGDKLVFKKERYPFLPEDVSMETLLEKHNNRNIKINSMFDIPEFVLSDVLEREKSMGQNHPLNIDSSCVVYFFENKIYIQFFGLPYPFQKKIVEKYQLVDYHYQNQTDISNYDWNKEKWDNMTDERRKELNDDWKERQRVWDGIMPDWSDSPSECGLIFEFMPNHYEISEFSREILNKLSKNIPNENT